MRKTETKNERFSTVKGIILKSNLIAPKNKTSSLFARLPHQEQQCALRKILQFYFFVVQVGMRLSDYPILVIKTSTDSF